ncbi:histidinol-phosphate transaminase [Paraburkholderia fungorum]|uniref:histidinol-phosphate transaminase n=1 Tax=Paraburkholderia fungorum TaxID=134537 RepID=UPI00402B1169
MDSRRAPTDRSASSPTARGAPIANDWIAQVQAYRPGAGGDVEHRDAIRLCSNENPFGKTRLKELAQRLAECNVALYPDNDYPGLKHALAQAQGVRASQLLIGNGSSEVLTLLARTFLSRGRIALCSTYSFSLFSIVTSITGAEVRRVPSLDYGHDIAALVAEANGAQVIFIDNPCNPTGRYLDRSAWVELLRQVPVSTLVVIDEAYAEYVTQADFESCIGLVDEYPNLVVVRTLSKAYGLAGLRLGYGVAGEGLIALLERARSPFNVNTLTSELARAALADTTFLEACRSHNAAERTRLEAHPAIAPYSVGVSHGNFIFLKLPRAAEIAEQLKARNIHVRGFAEYPDHLRVTIGTVNENQRFIDAFVEVSAHHESV